jgi:hypothetical protein
MRVCLFEHLGECDSFVERTYILKFICVSIALEMHPACDLSADGSFHLQPEAPCLSDVTAAALVALPKSFRNNELGLDAPIGDILRDDNSIVSRSNEELPFQLLSGLWVHKGWFGRIDGRFANCQVARHATEERAKAYEGETPTDGTFNCVRKIRTSSRRTRVRVIEGPVAHW